jgi:hypothetical protein
MICDLNSLKFSFHFSSELADQLNPTEFNLSMRSWESLPRLYAARWIIAHLFILLFIVIAGIASLSAAWVYLLLVNKTAHLLKV